MKRCKVYSTERKIEVEGVIIDGRVLLPAPYCEDTAPAHVIEGQCYRPPIDSLDFAKDMLFDLMPFSTECEWGEYADEHSPVRCSANFWGYDDYDTKWGYCDTKTGLIRIAPEMEHCDDFNAYGSAVVKAGGTHFFIDTNNGQYSHAVYYDVEKSMHGVFFVSWINGWGAVDSQDNQLLDTAYNGIEWDGMGGFTTVQFTYEDRYGERERCEVYGVNNMYCYGEIVRGLREKPVLYDFPSEKRRLNKDRNDDFENERFRLTKKENEYGKTGYGLIRDVLKNKNDPLSTYSEEVLEPIYAYDEIPDAAYAAWVEKEIQYFVRVLCEGPQCISERNDFIEGIPEDIRGVVRCIMALNAAVDDAPKYLCTAVQRFMKDEYGWPFLLRRYGK
jgi:hypothetical protein